MSEITLTRALVKLKTMDKKIQAAIDGAVFVSRTGTLAKPAVEATHAADKFRSIEQMIEYRRTLKSAIITSNATTTVTINGKVCTVAEAIEEKKSIKHKKKLHDTLKKQYAEQLRAIEVHNDSVRKRLEAGTKQQQQGRYAGGWEPTPLPEVDAAAEAPGSFSAEYSKNFMQMHGLDLYDPLDARAKIEALDDYITTFMDEVDQVLSESNATTKITV